MFQIDDMLAQVSRGTVIFLGLLVLLAFVANAVLLIFLLVKRGSTFVARCPKCGRMVICPHCNDDSPPVDQSV
jgi:hypothetical protein